MCSDHVVVDIFLHRTDAGWAWGDRENAAAYATIADATDDADDT